MAVFIFQRDPVRLVFHEALFQIRNLLLGRVAGDRLRLQGLTGSRT
ncbi:hypothetical protein ACFQAT_14020 [Undibacterium arcticum]|uniref:Uncharacterized protein n=1 Tax=Undibacterium arcticum TaxID=1762892 RepID=A0ABV7F7A0_9BURK